MAAAGASPPPVLDGAPSRPSAPPSFAEDARRAQEAGEVRGGVRGMCGGPLGVRVCVAGPSARCSEPPRSRPGAPARAGERRGPRDGQGRRRAGRRWPESPAGGSRALSEPRSSHRERRCRLARPRRRRGPDRRGPGRCRGTAFVAVAFVVRCPRGRGWWRTRGDTTPTVRGGHDEPMHGPRHGHGYSVSWNSILSSSSCDGSTAPGAFTKRQLACAVFGKAITSRIDSPPASIAHSRSTPSASPPCGGAP